MDDSRHMMSGKEGLDQPFKLSKTTQDHANVGE